MFAWPNTRWCGAGAFPGRLRSKVMGLYQQWDGQFVPSCCWTSGPLLECADASVKLQGTGVGLLRKLLLLAVAPYERDWRSKCVDSSQNGHMMAEG